MVIQAKVSSKAMSRSAARQIEYWAKLGKVAEENPDLPCSFIKDVLLGQEEVDRKQLEAFQFES